MLEEITIQNIATVKRTTIPFSAGLNIISGESGVGKTVLLNALGLLLGKRSDPNLIRADNEQLSVEGIWSITDVLAATIEEQTGATIDNNELFINRTVQRAGKNRAIVGGKNTPTTILSGIGEQLVNIHGQSDQIKLHNQNTQREALDTYAGEELQNLLKDYLITYNAWRQLSKKIKDFRDNSQNLEREFEELQHAISEIDKVNPVVGEDNELATEVIKLSNLEELNQNITKATNILTNDDYDIEDLMTQVSKIVKILNDVTEYDKNLETNYEMAVTIQSLVNELSGDLASYLGTIDMDSLMRLNEIQERIAAINKLKRLYGPELDDVLKYYEKAQSRVTNINPENYDIDALDEEYRTLSEQLKIKAKALTDLRTSKSRQFSDEVNIELEGLAMSGNKLVIEVTSSESYTTTGVDTINFMMRTPGTAALRPISKTASGGELSRIMLAIEVVLADKDDIAIRIFDEIEQGVGGATAQRIAERLARLAKTSQIIVITHLPQIAAYGDNHLRVIKTVTDNEMFTEVVQLNSEERISELTRMLSGLENSETGQAHAVELLETATEYKNSL